MMFANRPYWSRRLPPQAFWAVLVACCVACPVAYLLLDKPVFDWQVRRGFVLFSNLWIDAFRLLGKAWLLVWLLLVSVALTGRWRRPYVALLALLILALPLNAVKLLVDRARPADKIAAMQAADTAETVEPRGLSFPSGDTASAFAVAAALGVAAAWPWATAALLAAAGVGAMRVVDLAHHPSDVLAGAAFGVAAALAAVRLAPHWPPPGIESWHRPAARWAAIILPTVVIAARGTDMLVLLLESYLPLILVVYLVARARRAYLD